MLALPARLRCLHVSLPGKCMKSFFQRWWPFARSAPAHVPTTGRSDPLSAASAVASAPAAMDALIAVGARRPLVSVDGMVVGYEFRLAEALQQRLDRRVDQQGQAAYLAALMASARLVVQAGRIGFARFPAGWLVHAVAGQGSNNIWVGLERLDNQTVGPELLATLESAIGQLRASGAKVGWEVTLAQRLLPGLVPDFVLLRQGDVAMAALLGDVKNWHAALRGRPILLTDVANIDDLELALDQGMHMVCGALTARDPAGRAATLVQLRPEVRRVGSLLQQLIGDAPTSVIVGQIKGDVGLSVQLLRRMNSASLAHLNAASSIESAVALLGRDGLYRWLSLLLLHFAGSRKAAAALQESALWRSRLLELLALECREPAAAQLFTLGLASMLGQILGIGMADVVTTLRLPDASVQALQQQTGPWHPYLQLAQLLQAQRLDECEALAARFGGMARVAELSESAWAWAAHHAQSDKEGA